MRHAVAAAISFFLLAAGAFAQLQPTLLPIPVRIVGYLGQMPAGVTPNFTWKVWYNNQTTVLYISTLDVRDATHTALDIDAAVDLYGSRFLLAGERNVVDAFTAAPQGQQIVIMGYVRLDPGEPYLLVTSFDRVQPPTPQATP